MVERLEGRIEWEHTGIDTIEGVLTFLYYGDYNSPSPTLRESQDQRNKADESELKVDAKNVEHVAGLEKTADQGRDAGAIEPVAEDVPNEDAPDEDVIAPEDEIPEPSAQEPEYVEDEDPDFQNAILQSCNIRPLTPLGKCIGLSPIATMRKSAGGVFEDQDFPYQNYSYQAPLFAHAEVYSFAKYHLLPALQNLALQRMTQILRSIDCSAEHAGEELSAIIEYVYNNIESSGDDEEPMQKILSQFAAIYYPALLHGKFEELFSRGGEFTRDVARKLSRRLSAHGVAAEIEDDEVGCRIEGLETQIQERDDSIRSLIASLNDATVWGRGINRKGNRRR
jgi:hypothetical protein